MLFRERGKKVYIIRTVYNKDKGRGEQVTVCKIVTASLPFISIESDEIRTQLISSDATADEFNEISEWLKTIQAGKKEASDKVDSRCTLSHLITAHNILKRDGVMAHVDDELAAKLFAEMKRIRDVLREAGHKEKRAKKTNK